MSLRDRVYGETFEDVDPGYISEPAMEQMCVAILCENLTPEELEEAVNEAAIFDIVTEAGNKNIVKLNKAAKFQRAYKIGILQCAAEDKRKEYKKLRTLWKMEAHLFNKLEKIYKNKAMAKAREAVKKTKRSKSNVIARAGERAGNAMAGAGKQLNSKIIKNLKK